MEARHLSVSPTVFLKPSFALTVCAGHGLQVTVKAQLQSLELVKPLRATPPQA